MATGDGVIGDETSGPVDPVADDQTGSRQREPQSVPADTSEWDERVEQLEEAAIQAEYATGRREPTEEKARRNVVLRVGTIIVGFIVVLAGIVMLVLPGQGILTIIAGLAILSRELPWAERWLAYAKKRAKVDQLQQQPKWVQAVAWGFGGLLMVASIYYFFIIR